MAFNSFSSLLHISEIHRDTLDICMLLNSGHRRADSEYDITHKMSSTFFVTTKQNNEISKIFHTGAKPDNLEGEARDTFLWAQS